MISAPVGPLGHMPMTGASEGRGKAACRLLGSLRWITAAALGCILLKKWARGDRHAVADSGRACPPSPSGRCGSLEADHRGYFGQVRGAGGAVELVFSSVRAAQAQAVQLQDAFEVSEEQLDHH